MISLLQLAGGVIVICITYMVTSKWSERTRFDKAAREYACKPVTRYPNRDSFLGVDLFVALRKADYKGRLSEVYRVLHKKYGATFEMKALSGFQLQTSQPENIQAICTSAFNDFGVGPMRGRIGVPFLDRGIFTEDGVFWKHSRALIRPTFSRAEIADLSNFERHVARLLALIPRDSTTFDLLPLAKRLFLDTSTEFLFGQSTDSLLPQTPFATEQFMKAFDRSLLGLALLLIFGPFRFFLYFDSGWKKAYTKVHSFVDKHVEVALNRQRSPSTDANSAAPRRYVLLEEMAMATQDPYDLRNQILNVFFPARDTAAIAFGDIMFELARHPREWEKLRAEVLGLGTQPLTFELIRSLKITKSIINESLRLHPAASRIGRTALRDTILPVGGGPDGQSPIFVPQGRVVEMDLYSVQRDPKIWGVDTDEFKPDRWSEGRPLWEAEWQYEPFLGGIRMCPAQNQVLTQLAYLLVRFAQEFSSVENRDEVYQYVEKVTMTVESRNGVKVALLPKYTKICR